MTTSTLHGLLPLIQSTADFQQLCHDLKTGSLSPGEEPLALNVLSAARPFLAATLASELSRPILIITARPELALQFEQQIRLFLSEPKRLRHFPEPGVLPYERAPWSHERVQQRLTVLSDLIRAESLPIVITSAQALLQPTIPRAFFERHVRHYQLARSVSLRFLLASWDAMGYKKVNTVMAPGQYAHRGGILDIFPTIATSLYPVRIELWGDEVDSIRTFDPLDQRSIETIEQITIPPASEVLYHRNQKIIADQVRALDYSTCAEEVKNAFAEESDKLENGERFDGIEFYLPYFYEQTGTLFDYLPDNTLVLIDDWGALELNVEELESSSLQRRHDMIMRGELPQNYPTLLHTWDDLRDQFSQYPPIVLGYGLTEVYELGELFIAGSRYGGRLHEAISAMRDNQHQITQVLLTQQAERMAEMLRHNGIIATRLSEITTAPVPGTLNVVNETLSEGFNLKIKGQKPFHLITDGELFGFHRVVSRKPLRPRKGLRTEIFFAQIKEGDYVVHSEHGIALYKGLIQRDLNGLTREYLELEYAQGDKLFVPVNQADRVAKYIGPGDGQPTIHRLGTADWETARRRAQKAVEEIADELLELYAARATLKGHAFSPDTPWQAEMEARFDFTETEDQLRVIEEVKRDMESPRPMDRMVIGDVGFGKTEVALRAAFKAVMDSKQVAVLVPTTVLAQQHYKNFSERLMAYPITVDMLSRFRNDKEQSETITGLLAGTVDIVIGTHRLLSKDVEFKDLGLVIIDEEQRFGVTHKEHLKQLRKEVDVLTLTATPIPRSLHMSLTGVRDMSTINTPPKERLPIMTKVTEWNDNLIRRAILYEMDRGGQVFFVHNRVMSIYAIAKRVGSLVPEARIAVAHGQMNEGKLEQTMLDFSEGAVDILVCTSIIENGLDLRHVNTIIIDRADMFGLAQLYQLRGRVGRGSLRGNAYFIHPRITQLTMEALERLEVMQEATELGAGFRIAMKDLEIRGAGELLGAKQSGNIAAVGFDMYTKLLEQAIMKRRQELEQPNEQTRQARREIEETTLNLPSVILPLQAYLPESYIQDEDIRLQIYRRMAEASSLENVAELEQELRDRFGRLAEPVDNVLYILRLRMLAAQAGITQISIQSRTGQIMIQLPNPSRVRLLAKRKILRHIVRYGQRELLLPRLGDTSKWKAELEDVCATLASTVENFTPKMEQS